MGRSFPICSPTRNQSNKRHCHTFPAVSLSLALPSPTFAKSALAATANVTVAKSRVHTLPSPVAAQSTVAAPAQSAEAKSSPCPAKGPVAATAQVAASSDAVTNESFLKREIHLGQLEQQPRKAQECLDADEAVASEASLYR
jgi:hypothetical protein